MITTISQVQSAVIELRGAFREIQQPRSDFALEHFVVGQHDTEPARYAQCVLELQIKYNAIRRGQIKQQIVEIEIKRLVVSNDEIKALEAQEKAIDLEDLELAMSGAFREFSALYAIWKSFETQYTHEELQGAQVEYWHKRLEKQANQDLAATGRIGVGNQDALAQIGIDATGENNEIHTLFAALDERRGTPALPGG